LYPVQPQTFRKGLVPAYGSSDSEIITTLQQLEDFAPPVARLIAGLSPEEAIAVLQEKKKMLSQYTKIPVLGKLAQQKINEYEARILALQPQAKTEQQKRFLSVALLGAGVLLVGTLITRQIFQIRKGQ